MYVQIDGNIGSGKSSLLAFLSALLVDTATYPEALDQWGDVLNKFHENKKEWGLPLTLDIIRSHERVDLMSKKHTIVERGPLTSRYVFSEILLNDGDLSQTDMHLIDKYVDLFVGSKYPDAFLYIDVPVGVCYDRLKAKRRHESDSMVTYDDLKILEYRYNALFDKHPNIPVHRLRWREGESMRAFHSRALGYLEDMFQNHDKKNRVHHNQ